MATVQVPTVNGHHLEPHSPSIQDVVDESDLRHPEQPRSTSVLEDKDAFDTPSWVPSTSGNATTKQTSAPTPKETAKLDTQSHELFPELGAPKGKQAAHVVPNWGSKRSSAVTSPPNPNGATSNGTNAPVHSSSTSSQPPRFGPQSLPGQHQERISLQPSQILPRAQMRRPLQDVLKDINKRSKANVAMSTGQGGLMWLTATGPEAACRQALHEVVAQVGSKQSVEVLVPASARAHIIGKAGSKIKEIQEKTGARVSVQKQGDMLTPADEDDDIMIPVLIEGNAVTAESARKEVLKIAGEKAAAMNTKLRGIPAEFYPFLAGPHNMHVNALEEARGLQIRVPPHHIWTTQPPPDVPAPGQVPAFLPAHGDNHITLAGERAAVQAAKADIERRVEELRRQLILDQFPLNRGRHQFIIGQQGISPQQFLAETGCAIILPGDADDDTITVVGPSDRIQAATDRAMELASEMQSNSFDISRLHRNAPGGAALHALNVTRYLRERQEIARLEALHHAHIVTPMTHDGLAAPWELYAREGKNAIRAQSDIDAIVKGHPPSRMSNVPVDPFFHLHLRNHISPKVQQDHGVRVVLPTTAEPNAPVLLVFEGPSGQAPDYQVPRGAPDAEHLRACQRGLEDARQQILDIINAQPKIVSEQIDVPRIFHEKLRKFIYREQQNRGPMEIPVRVTPAGTVITLKGPEPAVVALAAKVNAFVQEAVQDEKERGHTLSFDFPQKHANQLIGKGGSNIRDLRDKFDVEIQVSDGQVELKGPPAKANAAKTHIMALGRQWADEATYTLKVDPQYHRELIGAQGAQINKLQTRYKVQIHFPRSAKPGRDDQSAADGSSDSGRKPRREPQADEVMVRGPKKGADEARDEILSLLQYIKDTSHTATVAVQQSQLPSLIGQRGSGMDDLRQMTGARIDVPNSREPTSDGKVEIRIKGTKSQVAQAKKLIEEKRNVFDQTVVRTMDVDKKHHRALIGPQGSILRDMVIKAGGSDDRRELARTVQFPKAESDGNTIKLEGHKDVVEKIMAAMEKIIATRDNQITETIDVPAEKHRSLIGRGGDIKKDLESQFSVSLDIPRQGQGTMIKVTGLAANVEQAKARIVELTHEPAGSTATVQIPRQLHHAIADNGQFFRRMRNEHGVTIDHAGEKPPAKPTATNAARSNGTSALPLITDDPATETFSWSTANAQVDVPGDISWVLRGPPEKMARAQEMLEVALQSASAATTYGYLTLGDPGKYRFVIGQGGKTVNAIRKATGCKITVPRDGNGESIIVEGGADGCERAREMILAAVREGPPAREY